MEKIREYIETFAEISDEEWAFFSSKFDYLELPKKTKLLQAGETENYLSYLETGIVRFFIPRDENDITFVIAFSGWFMSAYDSFITQQPSIYHVETLSSTALYRISHADLQSVYKETKIGNLIGRMAGEQLFLGKTKREIAFLSQSAEERYRNLCTEQPQLLQLIPLKYIASYIGVTPQALSRIRKRIY